MPGEGHPDEVVLPAAKPPPPMQPSTRSGAGNAPGPSNARPPQTPKPVTRSSTAQKEGAQNQQHAVPAARGRESSIGAQPPPRPAGAPAGGSGEPVAFFSARSVHPMPDDGAPGQTGNANAGPPKQLFNPKAESPSIRKTPGIDHSSSRPVARNGQHVPPASSQASGPGAGLVPGRPSGNGSRGNVVNPSLDQTRRIGAPGGPGSPLANRGSYKPPTMKRPLPGDGNAAAAARSPLVDVAANTVGQGQAAAADVVDSKRQKMV